MLLNDPRTTPLSSSQLSLVVEKSVFCPFVPRMTNMQRKVFLLFSLVLTAFLSNSSMAQCVVISPDADSVVGCPGGSLMLAVSGGSDYHWSPAADFNNPAADSVTLTPSMSQWYYVSGTVGDTTCTDSIYVLIPTFSIAVSTTDTICPLDVVTVSYAANTSIGSLSWNTTAGVQDSLNTSGTDIMPRLTDEYVVTAYFGDCMVSDSFMIHVKPFRFEALQDDTIYLCLGDSGVISHFLSPTGGNVIWSPLDSTIRLESPVTAIVKPTVSATYMATTSFENCVLSTTTFVRADSLPDSLLTVIPLKDPYCAGEMVTVFAEHADTMKYPDIMFQWQAGGGAQILDSANTGNVVVQLQDTVTLMRYMTNHACRDSSQVTLNVIPPDLPLSVMDTTLCPGDMFIVQILDPNVSGIMWMPADGLSCTSCFSPKVTVQAIPETYMVTAKKHNCTVGGMLSTTPFPPDPAQLSLGGDPPYGVGESPPITIITVGADTTIFHWTVNNMELNGTAATNNVPLDKDQNVLHIEWLNSHNCEQVLDTIIMTIPPNVKIPNAFTPNRQLNFSFQSANRWR